MTLEELDKWIETEILNLEKEINESSERLGPRETYTDGFALGELQGRLNMLERLYRMLTGQ